jgi:hypothetical protein
MAKFAMPNGVSSVAIRGDWLYPHQRRAAHTKREQSPTHYRSSRSEDLSGNSLLIDGDRLFPFRRKSQTF